jgi:hypothetical protein
MLFHRETELRHRIRAVVGRLVFHASKATPIVATARATKRAVLISCVGFALACTPAAQSTNAPVETALAVPPLADAGTSGPHDGVRFGHVPAAVGMRWAVSTRAESRTDDGDQRSRYESDYTVEVLAIEGAAPSRVRLRFDRNVSIYREAERPTTVHGNTYVVDGAEPYVRDTSGAAASENETERVLDVFPDLGTRTRIDEVLPDAPMSIGDSRDELAAALLRLVHPRLWQLTDGKATLARVETGDAIFAIVIVAESRASGVKMDVKGEARIRARDSRLVGLELDGAYDHGEATKGSFSLRRVVRDR